MRCEVLDGIAEAVCDIYANLVEGDAENAFLRTIQSDPATAFLSSISSTCRIGVCSAIMTMKHVRIYSS